MLPFKQYFESYFGNDIDISDINLGTWKPIIFQDPNTPKFVGEIENKDSFSSPKVSVLDMVIKLPGEKFKIPFDNKAVHELIYKCITFENRINPDWESNSYVYLTIHQGPVKASQSQRNAGAHIDGMQGLRYKEKIPVCHSYIITDQLPSKFYHGKFSADQLSYKYDNWFKAFQSQLDQKEEIVAKPYGIYFMTAYNVHESPISDKDIKVRTFMRLEFSHKQFNRVENTKNPKLDPGWKLEDRPIPKEAK